MFLQQLRLLILQILRIFQKYINYQQFRTFEISDKGLSEIKDVQNFLSPEFKSVRNFQRPHYLKNIFQDLCSSSFLDENTLTSILFFTSGVNRISINQF